MAVFLCVLFFLFAYDTAKADPYAAPTLAAVGADGYGKKPAGDSYDHVEHINRKKTPSSPAAATPAAEAPPAPSSDEVRKLQEDAAKKQLAADKAKEAADLKAQSEAEQQQAALLREQAEQDDKQAAASVQESDQLLQQNAEKSPTPADGGYMNVDEDGYLRTEAAPDSEQKQVSPTVTCEKKDEWDDEPICTREDGSTYNQVTKKEIDGPKTPPADGGYRNVDEQNNVRMEDAPDELNPQHTLHCEKKGVTRQSICTRADGSTYDEKTGKELTKATRSDEEAKRLAQMKKEQEETNPTVECKYNSSFSSTRTCRRADGSEYDEKSGKQTKPPSHSTGAAQTGNIEDTNPTLRCEKKGMTRQSVCTRADGSTYDEKTGKPLSHPTKTAAETKKAAEDFHNQKKAASSSPTLTCKYESTLGDSRTCTRADGSKYDEVTGKEIKPPKPKENPDNPTINCKKSTVTRSEVCERADGSTYDPNSHKELSPPKRNSEETRQIVEARKKLEGDNPTISCDYPGTFSSTRVCTTKDGSTYDEATRKVLSGPKEDNCVYENPESRTKTCTRPDGTKYDEESKAELGSDDQGQRSKEDNCVYENPESRTKTCTRPDGTTYEEDEEAESGADDQKRRSKEDNCVYENPESRTKTCTRPDGTTYEEDEEEEDDSGEEEDDSGEEEDDSEEGPAKKVKERKTRNIAGTVEDDEDEEDPEEDANDGAEDSDEEESEDSGEEGDDDSGSEESAEPEEESEEDSGSEGSEEDNAAKTRNIAGTIDDDQGGERGRPASFAGSQSENAVRQEARDGTPVDTRQGPRESGMTRGVSQGLESIYDDDERTNWRTQSSSGGAPSFIDETKLSTQVPSGPFDRNTQQNTNAITSLSTGYVQSGKSQVAVNPFASNFMKIQPRSRYEP